MPHAAVTLLIISLTALCWLLLILIPALTPVMLQPVMPVWLLICLHAWERTAPVGFPVWLLFLSGLLADYLSALPLGALTLMALLMKLYLFFRRRSRLSKQAFWLNWLEFGWLGSLSLLGLYALLSVYHGQFFPLLPVLLQIGLTLLCYPLIYRLYYALVQRILPHRRIS